MQFVYYAPTPKSTTAANPLVTTCALTFGVITSILVVFPKGCAGLVGLQLKYHSEQVFPWNQNAWLTGDDLKENFVSELALVSDLYSIDMITYNTDDTYAHTPYVVFTVQPIAQAPVSGGAEGGGLSGYGDIYSLPSGGGGITPTPGACPEGQQWDESTQTCVPITPVTPITPYDPTKITKKQLIAFDVILGE